MYNKFVRLAVLFSCCFQAAEANAPKGAELVEVQSGGARGENPRPMTIDPVQKPDRPMEIKPDQPQPGGPPTAPSSSSTPLTDEEMERSINEDLESDEMKELESKENKDLLDEPGMEESRTGDGSDEI